MPIKVRCQECSTGMTVPDKAAGRAVKCKGCGGRVPVPGGAGVSSAPGQKRPAKKRPVKKRRRPAPAAEPSFDDFGDPDDMFGGLDLRRAEDHRQKVCPSCAQKVDEEDIECPYCGVNIETGALSEKQKIRKARKGPPPEEFYGEVWGNAWKFLMSHKGWAVKTGLNWGLSLAMVVLSAFVLSWYIDGREQELIDSKEGAVTITSDGVLIEPTKEMDAVYDGVKYGTGSTRLINGRLMLPTPRIAAIFSPPSFFWGFIFLIFVLSCGGWAWTLSGKIVELTMTGQKKIKRFQGDMYANMTRGFVTIFWPIVLMYPVIWIPLAMHFLGGVAVNICVITFLVMFMIPIVVFMPIAVVHMSQPYTYRAWLINWMVTDLVNALVPTMFVSAMFFGLVLLVPLAAAIGVAVGWDQFTNFYTNSIEIPALGAMFGYTQDDAGSSFAFAFERMPLLFLVAFTGFTLLSMLLAFPAIFMMRVFGLFGLYFRPDLSLCVEQVPLSPAGFGPRFLAIQVDAIIAAIMCGVSFKGSKMVAGLVGSLYNSETVAEIAYWATMVISILCALGFYFANWESGAGRATLGKWTFGLIVLRDDNEPMSFNQALKRAALGLISIVSLSGTFVMCAFHPEHRALHDILTKTKVVWRGDENM
ncbi:MAG: RDD family protein [Fuerstiella sp.]